MYVMEVLQTPGQVGSRDSVQKSFFNICTRAPKNRFMILRNSDSRTDERFILYCDGCRLFCFLAILQRPDRVVSRHCAKQSSIYSCCYSSFGEFISVTPTTLNMQYSPCQRHLLFRSVREIEFRLGHIQLNACFVTPKQMAITKQCSVLLGHVQIGSITCSSTPKRAWLTYPSKSKHTVEHYCCIRSRETFLFYKL